MSQQLRQRVVLPSTITTLTRWARTCRILAGLLGGLGVAGGMACSPTGQGETKLPPDVQDPATLHTPAGALELYRGAVLTVPGALDLALLQSAVFTDELAGLPTPFGVSSPYTMLDSRASTEQQPVYSLLHHTRAQLREARGFVTTYLAAADTATARELAGHLYALEGYADVLLADLFCSGIPLSTMDFNGDYTLAAGSSTAEVYRTAIGLFDSALGHVRDSIVFGQLAAVGRGRALLALDSGASAAAAVAQVPTDFRYTVTTSSSMMAFAFVLGKVGETYATAPGFPSVGEREGLNGLPYLSSGSNGDARVGSTLVGLDFYQHDFYFPTKYDPNSLTATLVLADGIEARLIEAEAALRGQLGGADWLARLNALRTDGSYDADPSDPTVKHWHAGSGGVPGLAPLDDPSPEGTPAGPTRERVDLLFRERAFWLYLTAHRQGDLRRLVRQYNRDPETVYPTGIYPGWTGVSPGGPGQYGTAVTFPVPAAEQQLNPRYSGCIHRNA